MKFAWPSRFAAWPLPVALLASLAPLAAQAAPPSFDCAKASHEAEVMVCQDDALAALDRQLAEVYAADASRLDAAGKARLRAEQLQWHRDRNECWKSDDKKTCVTDQYERRIGELQIAGGMAKPPTPYRYDCGAAGEATVRYYNEGVQRPMLTIELGTRLQDVAMVMPSASGARYLGRRIGWWNKGRDATLTVPNEPAAQCHER